MPTKSKGRKFRVERSVPFGNIFSAEIPDDCELVIVCENSGGGCCLPHQVYVAEFSAKPGLAIIPVRCKDIVQITELAKRGASIQPEVPSDPIPGSGARAGARSRTGYVVGKGRDDG